MDLQTIQWNLKKKEYLDCIKTALSILKTNYGKYSQQDLLQIVYEFILFKEYNKEQSKWIKVWNISIFFRIFINARIKSNSILILENNKSSRFTMH